MLGFVINIRTHIEIVGLPRIAIASSTGRSRVEISRLTLGGYTLEDFNRFFGAFTVIAAAHEFLCFAWGRQHGTFPYDAAVMVKLKSDWVRVLARLSGLTPSIAAIILDDLVFDVEKSIDLTLQPLVPLGKGSPWLAVAPPFPLSSRSDENILRNLSLSKKSVFSETSNSKEDELRNLVKAKCPQFRPKGLALCQRRCLISISF